MQLHRLNRASSVPCANHPMTRSTTDRSSVWSAFKSLNSIPVARDYRIASGRTDHWDPSLTSQYVLKGFLNRGGETWYLHYSSTRRGQLPVDHRNCGSGQGVTGLSHPVLEALDKCGIPSRCTARWWAPTSMSSPGRCLHRSGAGWSPSREHHLMMNRKVQ